MAKKITSSEFNGYKERTNRLSSKAKLENAINVSAEFNNTISAEKFNNLSNAIYKLEEAFNNNCCQSFNPNCCQACQSASCQSAYCQACQGCQSAYCQSCQSCQGCQSRGYQEIQCTYWTNNWGTH